MIRRGVVLSGTAVVDVDWLVDASEWLARGDDAGFAHLLTAHADPVPLEETRTTVRPHFLAVDLDGQPVTRQLANVMARLDFAILRKRINQALAEAQRTRSTSAVMGLYFNIGSASWMQPSNPGQYIPPSVNFKNGKSVDLDLDIGEPRPLGSYESEDEEFVLCVADAFLTAIHGAWQLTARDHNEVYKGEVTIPVASPVNVTDAAGRVLRLQGEEE